MVFVCHYRGVCSYFDRGEVLASRQRGALGSVPLLRDRLRVGFLKTKMQTYEIKAALAEKYKAPEYALLFEVGDGTGGNKSRYADAVAMSLWPSRGLHLIGFEIKASRADWLNEMKKPEKADAVGRYCDYWYLVVGDKKIVQDGELPLGWGLIAPRGEGLVIVREATKIECLPINRSFLAGLMRRNAEEDRAAVDEEIRRAVKKQTDELVTLKVDREIGSLRRENEKLNSIVNTFSESGINLYDFNTAEIAEIVKMVRQHGILGVSKMVSHVREHLDGLLKSAMRAEEGIGEFLEKNKS